MRGRRPSSSSPARSTPRPANERRRARSRRLPPRRRRAGRDRRTARLRGGRRPPHPPPGLVRRPGPPGRSDRGNRPDPLDLRAGGHRRPLQRGPTHPPLTSHRRRRMGNKGKGVSRPRDSGGWRGGSSPTGPAGHAHRPLLARRHRHRARSRSMGHPPRGQLRRGHRRGRFDVVPPAAVGGLRPDRLGHRPPLHRPVLPQLVLPGALRAAARGPDAGVRPRLALAAPQPRLPRPRPARRLVHRPPVGPRPGDARRGRDRLRRRDDDRLPAGRGAQRRDRPRLLPGRDRVPRRNP